MNQQEILALIAAISAAAPEVLIEYNKIAANSHGTIRPIEQVLKESDANFDAVIARDRG